MNLKIFVADDDEGMRLVLKKAINKVEGFELAGEAADGDMAVRFVEEHKPDVVFLDIEMPVLNGIECAKKIMDINPKTFIIFATAHEKYMPDAFSIYASDYLVKPFKLERIYQTLNRIKDLSSANANNDAQNSSLKGKHLDRLMIKNKESTSFIDINDIVLVQREDRSTVIYTTTNKYSTSDGLSEIEEQLNTQLFMRSHKSYIINISMVNGISPYGRWTYIVKFKNTDKDALITHDKYEELESIFKA